jgi:two-component system, OmpR family, KDP operon response regulator KdpE
VTHSQQSTLVIEDEPQIRRFVRSALEREGWKVYEASTMERGLVECGTRLPTLVLLDLGLPDGDGLSLIRELRTWSKVPLIVISARSSENQKIAALDAGADDYLTKPFGIGELLARVRAAMRRQTVDPAETRVSFGDVQIDLAARLVKKRGQPVHLTPIEYQLLTTLVAHAGTVLTHRQLLLQIWGPNHVESSHYLRIYMGTLRNKLEDDPVRPRHLLTVTAVGYRLDEAGD